MHISSSMATVQLILCCNITKPIRIPHRNCSPWRAFRGEPSETYASSRTPHFPSMHQNLQCSYDSNCALHPFLQVSSTSRPEDCALFFSLPWWRMEALSGEVTGMRLNQSSVAFATTAEIPSFLTVQPLYPRWKIMFPLSEFSGKYHADAPLNLFLNKVIGGSFSFLSIFESGCYIAWIGFQLASYTRMALNSLVSCPYIQSTSSFHF